MRNLIVNEYTVGGSLLLVGFGFFSTRFADILSYQVTTVPSAIPMIGGASVTVGRILGVVPATLGLAVLMGKFRKTPVLGELTKLPVVSDAYDMVEEKVSDIAGDFRDQIATSAQPTPEVIPMAAEGGISDEEYAAVPAHPSSFWFPKERLLLTVYVDDLLLRGPAENHEPFGKE